MLQQSRQKLSTTKAETFSIKVTQYSYTRSPCRPPKAKRQKQEQLHYRTSTHRKHNPPYPHLEPLPFKHIAIHPPPNLPSTHSPPSTHPPPFQPLAHKASLHDTTTLILKPGSLTSAAPSPTIESLQPNPVHPHTQTKLQMQPEHITSGLALLPSACPSQPHCCGS